ncbi:MAG: hypothetical protein VX768_19765 [Planctomycetota bacterium]|nr:hypothetical protein [Planctomycetota bacterium]
MLKTIPPDFENVELPDSVQGYLAELDRRVADFVEGKPFAKDGFVACNHEVIAQALLSIENLGLAPGNVFCEWGSGFGGVASVASLLGFESYGIEINREVLDHSIDLAEAHELDVDFIEGSFIPIGSDDLIDEAFMATDGDLTLEQHFDDAYEELGLDVSDFDIIFVFPWPNEAPLLCNIFDRFASSGALLMIFNDASGLAIHRKQ